MFLKSRVWAEQYGTVDDLLGGVRWMLDVYDFGRLELVLKTSFNGYSRTLEALRGNDFEMEHTTIFYR